MHTTHRLENVERMNAAHPDTFGIRDRPTRESLGVDQCAKLIFLADPERDEIHSERMWVVVTERAVSESGRVRYRGWLDNDPAVMQCRHGDIVSFGPEHVATTAD